MKRSQPLRRRNSLSEAQREQLDNARSARWARQEPIIKVCPVCRNEFRVKPSQALRRKCCSRACLAVVNAESQARRRRGERNPNYRHGRRAGVRDREAERRWYTASGDRCAHPTCRTPVRGLQLHHIVYRQHVRKEGGDEWDPRNGLTLCVACHVSHHKYGRVFPLILLPEVALEFAFDLLGPAAGNYLPRRYSGPAPTRFYELLAAAEAQAA